MAEGREPTYSHYYPHPARGLDPQAARQRVMEHPEVMPPEPRPLGYRRMSKKEVFGLRIPMLVGIVAVGVLGPLLIGTLLRRLTQSRGWSPERLGFMKRWAESSGWTPGRMRFIGRFRNGRRGPRVLLMARR